MEHPDDARERALLLLRSNHSFPGPFDFRVVARPGAQQAVVNAISDALANPAAVHDVCERTSRKGNFISVHIAVTLPEAESALLCWDAIKKVDGVITIF
jgi:putative lipoic acid-binding regulatory protein